MALLAIGARVAQACSCVTVTMDPVPPEIDLIRNSNEIVVFVGTALRVAPVPSNVPQEELPPGMRGEPGLFGATTTFLVEDYWSGSPLVEMITVKTPGYGPGCGFEFKEGECYLVEAWLEDASWTTTNCSMTGLARSNLEVLEKLNVFEGPPKKPGENGS